MPRALAKAQRAQRRSDVPKAATTTCSECCDPCPWYWEAIRCSAPGPCQGPLSVFICADYECAPGVPIGQGTIIRVAAGSCYAVSTLQKWYDCRPPNPPVPPPGGECLPLGAIVVDPVPPGCVPEGCAHPLCEPVDGYYRFERCACSPPGGSLNAVVQCSVYWAAVNSGALGGRGGGGLSSRTLTVIT